MPFLCPALLFALKATAPKVLNSQGGLALQVRLRREIWEGRAGEGLFGGLRKLGVQAEAELLFLNLSGLCSDLAF